jgi:hypothetical protein
MIYEMIVFILIILGKDDEIYKCLKKIREE